jgi:hypothetical protein
MKKCENLKRKTIIIFNMIKNLWKKAQKEILIGSIMGILLLLIFIMTIIPNSYIVNVSTGINQNNNIQSKVILEQVPYIKYSVFKPELTSQTQDNSPVFDVTYTIIKNNKTVNVATVNQIKASTLNIKLPYSAGVLSNGTITIEIKQLSYKEVIPIATN